MTEVLSGVFLAVLLIGEIWALKKVRLTYYDRQSLIIMVACTLCLASKLVCSNILEDGVFKNTMNTVNMVSDMTLWFMIYFFIFEMKTMSDLFCSATPKQYRRSLAKTNKAGMWFLIVSTTFSALFHVIVLIKFFAEDFFYENIGIMSGCSIVSRGLYLLMFSYSVYLWRGLARLFVNIKKQQLKDSCLELSLGNLLTIVWVTVLSLLLTYHHFSLVICGILEFYYEGVD